MATQAFAHFACFRGKKTSANQLANDVLIIEIRSRFCTFPSTLTTLYPPNYLNSSSYLFSKISISFSVNALNSLYRSSQSECPLSLPPATKTCIISAKTPSFDGHRESPQPLSFYHQVQNQNLQSPPPLHNPSPTSSPTLQTQHHVHW